MFVVFKWNQYDGEWDHKYFKLEENAEEYAKESQKETYSEVIVHEIQTED